MAVLCVRPFTRSGNAGGGEGSCIYPLPPHLKYHLPPSFSSGPVIFSSDLQTTTGWHPPLADKGRYPHPIRSGDPPDPLRGVLSTMTHPPPWAHEGVPPPCSGFWSPKETSSQQLPFPVQNGWHPPPICPEVPPHPIKVRYPLRPHWGVGLTQTPTPYSWDVGGGVPPLVGLKVVMGERRGSNPSPRTIVWGYSYLAKCHPSLAISHVLNQFGLVC
jgi:hypothetical protein